MDCLHIKIRSEIKEKLKHIAKIRGITLSELIRQALFTCYQSDLLELSDRQKQALEAYRGGFISLGKLSDLIGCSPFEMQQWLYEHKIPLNNVFSQDDVDNAQFSRSI